MKRNICSICDRPIVKHDGADEGYVHDGTGDREDTADTPNGWDHVAVPVIEHTSTCEGLNGPEGIAVMPGEVVCSGECMEDEAKGLEAVEELHDAVTRLALEQDRHDNR